MIFSSLTFLYVFLPFVLLAYYAVKKNNYRNVLLLLSSLVFFAWGGVSYSLLLILSIAINFFIGKGISKTTKSKFFLVFGICFNLLFIGIFKYAGMMGKLLNDFFNLIHIDTIKEIKIILPIGISFYTFQAISYLMDVYRKEVPVQKSIVNLGLYISLFPQLIAGPIVRYHDVSQQIKHRIHSNTKFSEGVMRFVLGLAKKVLIANNLAIVADYVFATSTPELTCWASWIGIIAYTFQIYYDFAGYSDMAIGLAKMFGFDLLENFNFPYISRSIQEFWRRWHISLSSWFRDYLYIPLGGNRKGSKRTYVNLFIVFFATGLWHGASWNFVAWGLLHGLFLILERLGGGKILNKIPGFISVGYTFFIVMLAWVLFRVDDFEHARLFYQAMFGGAETQIPDMTLVLMLTPEFIISFVIAVFGAFGGFSLIKKFIQNTLSNNVINKGQLVAYPIFIIVIMFITTMYLANNTYNPFIYFRF